MGHIHIRRCTLALLLSLALLTALCACGSIGGAAAPGDNASAPESAPSAPTDFSGPASASDLAPVASPGKSPVRASLATDTILSQYAAYDQYTQPGTENPARIIFTTAETVTDFQFLAVTVDPASIPISGSDMPNSDSDMPSKADQDAITQQAASPSPDIGAQPDTGLRYVLGGTFYSMDELTPARPLVVGMDFAGMMPPYVSYEGVTLPPYRGISFVDAAGVTRYFSLTQNGQDGSIVLTELMKISPDRVPAIASPIPSFPASATDLAPAATTADCPVSVAYATDAMLSQYADYGQFGDTGFDNPVKLIFTATEVMPRFEFFRMSLNPNADGALQYTIDAWTSGTNTLAPDHPVVIETGFAGDAVPCRGVAVGDSNGVMRYFALEQSGLDGSLVLNELVPAS
ncbi:MAG: hypothetical protein FWC62_01375 [Firmicutes bacterium]|nr:hypothetical protein [Bacillota bacterium]